VLVSIPGHLIGIPDFYWLVFDTYPIFTIRQIPQVWRIATSFLITGPKFGMALDPYFVFTYASSLETAASRFSQPGDFFMYLVFVSAIIVVSTEQYFHLSSCYSANTSIICPYSVSYDCHGS